METGPIAVSRMCESRLENNQWVMDLILENDGGIGAGRTIKRNGY